MKKVFLFLFALGLALNAFSQGDHYILYDVKTVKVCNLDTTNCTLTNDNRYAVVGRYTGSGKYFFTTKMPSNINWFFPTNTEFYDRLIVMRFVEQNKIIFVEY